MNNGVYQIRNLTNGKRYIGSAAGVDGIKGRWCDHKKNLCGDRHCNQKLQNAWNKYNEVSFTFEVLEECEPSMCIEREQYYLDTLLFASVDDDRFNRLGYNICRIAGSSIGYRHSAKNRKKLSEIAKERFKDPTKHPMYGVRLLGDKNGMYGKNHTTSSIKKMQGQNNGNVKLTEEQVREIKRLKKEGLSQELRGKIFGVSRGAIRHIDLGNTWSWVNA